MYFLHSQSFPGSSLSAMSVATVELGTMAKNIITIIYLFLNILIDIDRYIRLIPLMRKEYIQHFC